MPQTINKTENLQIIAGIFSDRENADKAIAEFQKQGVPYENIQTFLKPDKDAYRKLKEKDIQEAQAHFFDEAIQNGKTFVAIHNVTDPDTIIETFDRFGSEYNPDGSRNVRQDVAGMTAGAGAGAVVGGATGLATGGPVGAAIGAAAGALVGGGAGAAAGKAVEHKK